MIRTHGRPVPEFDSKSAIVAYLQEVDEEAQALMRELEWDHDGDWVEQARCINGHVFTTVPGSELEDRCMDWRVKNGRHDLLVVSSQECLTCNHAYVFDGTKTHNVQCLRGHVFTVPRGSELEARCKAREARGFLDALPINYDECPTCIPETLRIERANAYYLW